MLFKCYHYFQQKRQTLSVFACRFFSHKNHMLKDLAYKMITFKGGYPTRFCKNNGRCFKEMLSLLFKRSCKIPSLDLLGATK